MKNLIFNILFLSLGTLISIEIVQAKAPDPTLKNGVLLNCGLSFGSIQEIKIFRNSKLDLFYTTLSAFGAWSKELPLNEDSLANRFIKWSYRGENFLLYSKNGIDWLYRVYYGDDWERANIIGYADCYRVDSSLRDSTH